MSALDLTAGQVQAAHGSGGRAMTQLVDELFARELDNPTLRQRGDAAVLPALSGPLVLSTDGHVVSPRFFPGGDLGSLAVHGTLNDLAVSGARPLYLAAAFILEEGFALAELQRIVRSLAAAARAAGVPVVTGDTKVVEAGQADGMYITTTGVGEAWPGVQLGAERVRVGDHILLSGSVGDHGVAVMSQRAHLSFATTLRSDSAALHELVAGMVQAAPAALRWMRDPTRGGLAAAVNELAVAAGLELRLDEPAIPVRAEVAAACELLGLDPLHVANEGKLVAVCDPAASAALLAAMRGHPLGAQAACIGEVTAATATPAVVLRTALGTHRRVDWLYGVELPRIC